MQAPSEDMMTDNASAPVQAGVVGHTGQTPQGTAMKALDGGTVIFAGRNTSMSSDVLHQSKFGKSLMPVLAIDLQPHALSGKSI